MGMMGKRVRSPRMRPKVHYDCSKNDHKDGYSIKCGRETWWHLSKKVSEVTCKDCLRKMGLRR